MGNVYPEKALQVHVRRPRHLLDVWNEIEPKIRRSGRLVLFTDFDGTLVPIARTPGQVRLSSAVGSLLRAIRRKGVLVGIVSGRRLAELRTLAGLRGICYVGNHGYSIGLQGMRPRMLITPEQKREMNQVHRELARRLRPLAGIWLEPKEASVAVHYRNAERKKFLRAASIIREVRAAHSHLDLLSGKKVWEFLPDRRISKWTAMQQVLRQEGASRQRIVFYLGDDVTDERVFERMRGISVVVGRRRRTAARFFLRSPAEVRLFLERFAETAG